MTLCIRRILRSVVPIILAFDLSSCSKTDADFASNKECMTVLLNASRLPSGINFGYARLSKADALRLVDRHGFNIANPDPFIQPARNERLSECVGRAIGTYPDTPQYLACLKRKGNPDMMLLIMPESVSVAANAKASREAINRHLALLQIAERKLAREVVECTN